MRRLSRLQELSFEKYQDQMMNRASFLFDTFEGIDPNFSDGSPISKGDHLKRGLYDFVTERFSIFPNCNIIKGTVPLSLRDVKIESCCFLHLDMNSWEAELSALDYFLPLMTPGSIIILDDLDLHSNQAKHELPYLKSRGIPVLELPTGQGVITIH